MTSFFGTCVCILFVAQNGHNYRCLLIFFFDNISLLLFVDFFCFLCGLGCMFGWYLLCVWLIHDFRIVTCMLGLCSGSIQFSLSFSSVLFLWRGWVE